jgi:hypothetical protein
MKLRCADSAPWSVTHGRGDVRPGVARRGRSAAYLSEIRTTRLPI